MTPPEPARRELLRSLAALGVGGAVFQRAAAVRADESPPAVDPLTVKTATAAMVEQAEWVAGVALTPKERSAVAGAISRHLQARAAACKVDVPYTVPPAVRFDPTPGELPPDPTPAREAPPEPPAGDRPADDDLAFAGVAATARLLRAGKVSSVELTKLALARLKKYDPALLCVVTLLEEPALKSARKADEDRAAGKPCGPLHGLPWGAKDLIGVPGAPTTWGAAHFKDQVISGTATVAAKLGAAGCVLAAKLSLGTLALGDNWFRGRTRNPWNVKEGSSGSSAGSASAVAAGLVPFAIGSETLGSIVSPSTRCGVTGLRPTYGRVSRAGCMTLSWSMDKLGPMGRSAEDCALVLGAVHGADPADTASVDRPFPWPCPRPVKALRVGYTDTGTPAADRAELKVLKELGVTLVPIKLPAGEKLAAMRSILDAECAAAFDGITRAGVRDGIGVWGETFRAGRYVTAVDYLRANRVRSMVIAEMRETMKAVDLYVGGDDLFLTNMTGHPTVCLPNGFRKRGGVEVPTALTFTGRLFGESELLAVAAAYQGATGFHTKRPPMDKVTKEAAGL